MMNFASISLIASFAARPDPEATGEDYMTGEGIERIDNISGTEFRSA
jgi:hypothetical protein